MAKKKTRSTQKQVAAVAAAPMLAASGEKNYQIFIDGEAYTNVCIGSNEISEVRCGDTLVWKRRS